MKRFTELYMELDASNRTTAKLAVLKRYFAEAPPEDAAWAVYFLKGQRLKRVVKTANLREWAAEDCGFHFGWLRPAIITLAIWLKRWPYS